MAKENTTIYIILGLLTHENMSGYDIKKKIDTSISNFWDVGYGQIYPTLKVLETDGLIEKRNDTLSKGPEKITYSITDSGRNELMKWLSLPAKKEYVKYEILLKIFFGSLLPETENIKKVMEFRENKLKDLNLFKLFEQSLKDVLTEDKAHYYYYLTALFGEYISKAYIDWADEAVTLLENMRNSTN